MRRVIVGIAVVLCFFVTATAQDTELKKEVLCDDEQQSDFTTQLTELMETSAEYETPFQFLDALQSSIETQRFVCAGMALSGAPVEGKNKVVLGPIKIPDGLYRAIVTTPDRLLIQFTKLSGRCSYSNFFAEGDATNGSEELFEVSEDCEVMIEVEAHAEWEMKLIPLGD